MKEIISQNHTKGELITTVEEVYNLALQQKGIYVSSWKKISPAAFLINWQACMLIGLIKSKRLYYIIPIEKGKKNMWYESKTSKQP